VEPCGVIAGTWFRISAEFEKCTMCSLHHCASIYRRPRLTLRKSMSVICEGCGRSFTARGYNAHHSRQDAKPECQGRDKAQVAAVAVNARNYRVSVQHALSMHARSGGPGRSHGDLEDPDGDSEPGPGPGPAAPRAADSDAESGPGEFTCTLHVLYKGFT
jgi:hypothetical protein